MYDIKKVHNSDNLISYKSIIVKLTDKKKERERNNKTSPAQLDDLT